MTPEEKAEKLVEKFVNAIPFTKAPRFYAVKCALICCDELINSTQYDAYLCGIHPEVETVEYWQEVKNHLIKM